MPNIGHHCHQPMIIRASQVEKVKGKKKKDFAVFGGESVIKSERISKWGGERGLTTKLNWSPKSNYKVITLIDD